MVRCGIRKSVLVSAPELRLQSANKFRSSSEAKNEHMWSGGDFYLMPHNIIKKQSCEQKAFVLQSALIARIKLRLQKVVSQSHLDDCRCVIPVSKHS